ncbi:nuclear transport factor 2 family protein [Yinghuangia seranimata]|uniref:nuclear transport factor 2 family protein n=1 Tax=Yinghuangia seranimata TaxID=408067 RepID=UPI00248B2370|nr:nuclear transport factor 2 family protein [Yinghuangia seranimata]MDI2125083.1 nuclear transport factor 2 family protein [Yinghuangia seranimata]
MSPERQPGHIAVPNLIALYAEAIDAGDFEAVADLLADCTITTEGTDTQVTGRDAVLALYETWTRRYDDGTPRTKHVTTNLILDIDDYSGEASARSYFTVLQSTPDLPLQPIITGRYRDTFTRNPDGAWRFTTRHMTTEHTGDLTHHLNLPLS